MKTYKFLPICFLFVLFACGNDDNLVSNCYATSSEGKVVKVLCGDSEVSEKECSNFNTEQKEGYRWTYELSEGCRLPNPPSPI